MSWALVRRRVLENHRGRSFWSRASFCTAESWKEKAAPNCPLKDGLYERSVSVGNLGVWVTGQWWKTSGKKCGERRACAWMWSFLRCFTCGVLYRPAEFSSPRMSHRCSDAGICGMVSERQAGFESKTDAVGSEGIEDISAIVVLSMKTLRLAAQQNVCCDWYVGWESVMLQSWWLGSWVIGPLRRSQPRWIDLKLEFAVRQRESSESSSRECSCKMVGATCSRIYPRGDRIGQGGLLVQLQKISMVWRKDSEWRRMSAYIANRNTLPRVRFRVL